MGKWIGRVVGLAIAVAVLWLAVIIFVQTRHSHLRAENKSRLKQILQGLHQYHDAYGVFPPAYVTDASGHRLHSWRVLLLPYLGEEELYHKYDLSQLWDSPGNLKLKDRIPRLYCSPFASGRPTGNTPFLAVVESRSAWPGPVSISFREIEDGSSNTIGLVSLRDSQTCWLAPDDISLIAAGEALTEKSEDERAGTQVGFMDGGVRFISSRISRDIAFSLLTRSGGRLYPAVPLDRSNSKERSLPPLQPVEQLQATEITATPLSLLTEKRNTLYCSTFQMAWDKLKDRVHAEQVLLDTPTELVRMLNATRFPVADLDAASCFAAADDCRSIQAEMAIRFPGVLVNLPTDSAAKNDIACFAYLVKRTPFAVPFSRLADPIRFGEGDDRQSVQAFGMMQILGDHRDDHGLDELCRQVSVLDYASDRDFVIRLSTTSPQADQIILARMPQKKSLEECWDEVQRRSRQPGDHRGQQFMRPDDTLQVPVVTFNLQQTYRELLDQTLVTTIPDLPTPQRIHSSQQVIGFRLDEAGADLVSWNEMLVVGENGGSSRPREQPRHFVFDEPYFLALQERRASRPYFMVWIGNTELMELNTKTPRHD